MKRLTITLSDIPPDADEGLTVSFREAVYYSRRLQLLLRGVGFHRASSRARLLAHYIERRRSRVELVEMDEEEYVNLPEFNGP